MYRRKHWTDTHRVSIHLHYFFSPRADSALFYSIYIFLPMCLWIENKFLCFSRFFFSNPFPLKEDKVSRRTIFLLQNKLLPLLLLRNEISFSNSWRLEMIITWMSEMNKWMRNHDGMRISRFTVNIQSTNYFERVNSIRKNSIRICQSSTFCLYFLFEIGKRVMLLSLKRNKTQRKRK